MQHAIFSSSKIRRANKKYKSNNLALGRVKKQVKRGNISNILFFQSLETFFAIFPTIGTFSGDFSNHWKNIPAFFQ